MINELLKVVHSNVAEAHNERCAQILEAILNAPTADVVPKSEVEELIMENESLAKTVNEASSLIRKLRNKVEKSQTEVAREIFADLERANIVRLTEDYWKIKDKYTEGKE